jgi:hypothetical protein
MPQVEYSPTTATGEAPPPDSFAGAAVYPPPKPPGLFGWFHHPPDARPLLEVRTVGFGLFRDRHRWYAWDLAQGCACAALTYDGWLSPCGTAWEPRDGIREIFTIYIASVRDTLSKAQRQELAQVLAVAVGRAGK